MAKFVPDIKTQRWIVIAQSRIQRPSDSDSKPKGKARKCPFCPGSEEFTPKEIMRLGPGDPGQPGWKVRVVPNKYPITDLHEVIIHSPNHHKDIDQLGKEHTALLLNVYRERFIHQSAHGQVMIFSNHGLRAGASLDHPHSQLVVIPRQINLDALVREPIFNVVEDNKFFVTYCPDFSQWPYELWIAPKKDDTLFSDITDEEIEDLSIILRKSLRRLRIKAGMMQNNHEDKDSDSYFAFNYYIHHSKNWFIRIIPRFVNRAGFELGTGLSVNVVDPTDAAEELSGIKM